MRITIVNDDLGEWEAMYVDGKKFTEGHSLRTQDWIDMMVSRGFIDGVEHKWVNNDKYVYDYSDGVRYSEPTFHEELSQYEEDDFE